MAAKAGCQLIKAGEAVVSKQAFTNFPGISAENTGAQAICMHLIVIPPGGRAKAHLHDGHETTLYVISGQAGMWYGDDLAEHMVCGPGDFLYIPAGAPHLPYNLSDSEPCVAVGARTDPNEQESVVLRPDLDALRPAG
ncbi:MAG: cupin domain-containing protein [Anaerolineales bacterium]|nr:cupin domain-containing protein [Anaerolineales bacterium]MCB8959695.1 cupin domain-containing protein [Ardenticatenales bacterium]